MSNICVIGSLNLDISYQVTKLPASGETVIASDHSRAFGGKGGNQAIAVAVLGGDVSFIGAIGQDEPGHQYLDYLRRHGIEVTGVAEVSDMDTGTAMILVDAEGENLIVVNPGANASLDADAVRRSIKDQAPALLLAQLEIPLTALEAAVESIPETATFVLNPAPMPTDPASLAKILARVDVLVPNRRELGQLVGLDEPRTLADVTRCLEAVPLRGFQGSVVVTLGADGAVILKPGANLVHIPAIQVDAVDTTGAGDAFCGALVVGLASGHDLAEVVQNAVVVAGRSTTVRGAQLPLGLDDSLLGES